MIAALRDIVRDLLLAIRTAGHDPDTEGCAL
jgi:hypothetical protein